MLAQPGAVMPRTDQLACLATQLRARRPAVAYANVRFRDAISHVLRPHRSVTCNKAKLNYHLTLSN